MSQENTDIPAVEAGKEEKRVPHSIRFLDTEWERIKAFAEERGLVAPEFIRFAVLAAIGEGRRRPVRTARAVDRADLPGDLHAGHQDARRDARGGPRRGVGEVDPHGPRTAGRTDGRRFGITAASRHQVLPRRGYLPLNTLAPAGHTPESTQTPARHAGHSSGFGGPGIDVQKMRDIDRPGISGGPRFPREVRSQTKAACTEPQYGPGPGSRPA